MRSSSRRLKVTFPGTMAGTLASPPRCSLGSVSPKVMRRLLPACDGWDDRAGSQGPQGPARRCDSLMTKSPKTSIFRDIFPRSRPFAHGFVRKFHNEAQFRTTARRSVLRETAQLIRARSRSSTGFLSPPAPRGLDRPGPSSRTVQSPHVLRAGSSRPDFFWTGFFRPRFFADCSCDDARLFQRRDIRAEHRARRVLAAGLDDHRDVLGLVIAELANWQREAARHAGPLAELDPFAHHVVIRDRVARVLALADRDRDIPG